MRNRGQNRAVACKGVHGASDGHRYDVLCAKAISPRCASRASNTDVVCVATLPVFP